MARMLMENTLPARGQTDVCSHTPTRISVNQRCIMGYFVQSPKLKQPNIVPCYDTLLALTIYRLQKKKCPSQSEISICHTINKMLLHEISAILHQRLQVIVEFPDRFMSRPVFLVVKERKVGSRGLLNRGVSQVLIEGVYVTERPIAGGTVDGKSMNRGALEV
jgi:hypothetical protein